MEANSGFEIHSVQRVVAGLATNGNHDIRRHLAECLHAQRRHQHVRGDTVWRMEVRQQIRVYDRSPALTEIVDELVCVR